MSVNSWSFVFLKRAKDGFFEVCGLPLKRAHLHRFMRPLQRCGFLFKCLNLAEYMFVKLVMKVTDGVRSLVLARTLAPIIKRLLEAIWDFPKLMREVLGVVGYWMMVKGWEKAGEISHIAQKWGNKAARGWAWEAGFARYLAIMNMSLWESESNSKAS
ncbi:MAG: hypothetical protein QXU81_09960 [Candidatus Bathyarchaeia archaeon]